jgi:hypothetical protein
MRDSGSSPESPIVLKDLPGGRDTFTRIVEFCYSGESPNLSLPIVASLFYV